MNQEGNEEKFVCVWLNTQSNLPIEYINAQDDLRTIINFFRNYNDLNQCVEFIINISTNIKIILIVVDQLAEKIVSVIHSCEQIHSIYIFESNTSREKRWTKDYQKIKGNYRDIKAITQKIKENLTQTDDKSVEISFISADDINSCDIKRQDPSFMHSQLLKDIILNDNEVEKENETKEDMLAYCRQIYAKSQDTLTILDEFEQNFIPELSIYWYTKECFLYNMLNTALWTPQPDVLYKLRYFIRHLHQQILDQAEEQRNQLSSMTVYRGQNMSKDQIEKLKQNVGGFLSFNNFLSTSLKRDVALNFLWGLETSVLFEMDIDPNIQKFPFANIEHLSYKQGRDSEQELLFSMGTVFRIIRIDKQSDFYHVQLMLSNDGDEQLGEYTKRTREEIRTPHSFLSLLKLTHALAQYNSVDRFAELLKDETVLLTNSPILGSIYHAFGIVYLSRGQTKEALDYFQKSLSTYLSVLAADDPKLSPTYSCIGSVHLAECNYETALTFHQLALDCLTKSANPNILSVVTLTNNIASVYYHQKNYEEALAYHKRALELQEQFLGDNHPSLTQTYSAISVISYKMNDFEQTATYQEKAAALQSDIAQSDPETSAQFSLTTGGFCLSQGDYKKALEHFDQALQTQQQYLLPNNPALANTYNHIADVYHRQNQFDESLSHHMKALEIEQNALSNDHPLIATSYLMISKDYSSLSFFSIALEYGLKAIEQIKKSPQTDITMIIECNQHVGYIYYEQHDYEQALFYYKRALAVSNTSQREDDALLVRLYDRIANTYQKLKKYNETLTFYQKTLDIQLKILPDNAQTIAVTYMNVSTIYLHLKQFDEASDAANKAHNQLLKTFPKKQPEVVQCRVFMDTIEMMQKVEESGL